MRSVTAIWEFMLSINLPTTGRRAYSEEESSVGVEVGVGTPEGGRANGVGCGRETNGMEATAGAEAVDQAG